MHSPLKPCLGRLETSIKIIALHIKTHAMDTHHRGAGCSLDRGIALYIEDPETTGLDNGNESTSGSDATVALGGPEAEGHPNDLIYSNQAKLMVLNKLMQMSRGQRRTPAESLDRIE